MSSALTRFPGSTIRRLRRPEVLARTSHQSKLSWARSRLALASRDAGLVFLEVGFIAIVLFGADRPALGQVLGPVILAFEAGPVGLQLLEIALGAVELGLERPRVDLEKQVTRIDEVAVLEVDLGHVTGNARSDLNREDRLGLALDSLELGDGLGDRQIVSDERCPATTALFSATSSLPRLRVW